MFAKYAEIANAAEEVEEYLRNNYKGELTDESLILKIKDTILGQAKKLLERAVATKSAQKLTELLETAKKEGALLSSTFRNIKLLNPEASLELLAGLQVETHSGPELTAAQVSEMLAIYTDNWKSKTTPEYLNFLTNKFIDSTKNPEARFHILTDNGKIISFGRFMPFSEPGQEPGLHFGAFNTDPRYQSGKIGEAFFFQMVQQESATELPMYLETNPENQPMLPKYKAAGFVAYMRTEHLGEPEVKMKREAQSAPLTMAA